jgi:hypothetical protein
LTAFENEYRKNSRKGRLAYVYSLASLGFTWALAYRLKFSAPMFLGTIVAGFAATHYAFRSMHSKSMKKNLNHYAEHIASKYPEIKYSSIKYVNSNQLHAKI